MKKIMGLNGNSNSDMEELAKKTTDGDFAELDNIMNEIGMIVLRPRSRVFLIVHCAREFFPMCGSIAIES